MFRMSLHTIDDPHTDTAFELENDVMPYCDICKTYNAGYQIKTLKISVIGEARKFVDSFDICPDCLRALADKIESGDA